MNEKNKILYEEINKLSKLPGIDLASCICKIIEFLANDNFLTPEQDLLFLNFLQQKSGLLN